MSKKQAVQAVKAEVKFVLDSVNLISSAFNIYPAKFNAKVNPTTGRKVITNIQTQILADKTRTFEVTYLLPDGSSKKVKRASYMPARLPDGTESRSQAGKYFTAYRLGQFKNKTNADKEFWSLLSYFLVCISRGKLPTPEKRSGASTIRATIAQYWLDKTGIKVESLKVMGGDGQSITYSPEQVNAYMTLFLFNSDDILTNWNDTIRGGKVSDFTI